MSDQRVSLVLRDAQSAAPQLTEAWRWIKAMLIAGHRLSFEVKKATRSVEQNGLLHSRIGDVAKHVPWTAQPWSWGISITTWF